MSTPQRRPLDLTGFWLMFGLALLFGANNVMIKLGNDGLQPVFFAGVRSLIAIVALGAWMRFRRIPFRFDLWRSGLWLGFFFSAEFLLLFAALDHTSVVRASSLFYAMPIWLALAGHFLFPGERLTSSRLAGFVLGFSAVVLTLAGRAGGLGDGNLVGDLAALFGGLSWAAIVVVSRTKPIGGAAPEAQIFWQVMVSGVVLTLASPLYGGDLIREFNTMHGILLIVQAIGVVSFGFVLWFWLIGRYQAGTVASFSFLTPILSAVLGWALLQESVAWTTPLALALLIAGLVLINRRPRRI